MNENPKLTTSLLLLTLVAAAGLYGMNLNTARFGAYHDDGIYAVTAKALATGQGYRIISLPDGPAQTKYPPVYPFLLSLVWRAYPTFPENVAPMMALSVIVTLGFLCLVYYYLVRRNYAAPVTALVIVFLTMGNVVTVYLATSVLSDMLYAALSIGALWLTERSAKARDRFGGIFAAGAVLGLTFLTRQAGTALLAAAAFYLLWRRSYRAWVGIIVVVILMVGPWIVWSRIQARAPVPAGLAYYMNYTHAYLPLLTDLRLLLNVLIKNLRFILTAMGAILFPSGAATRSLLDFAFMVSSFPPLLLGLIHVARGGIRLLYLYALFYWALLVLSPFPQYDRYLVPILPVLLLLLIKGGRQQWASIKELASVRQSLPARVMMATYSGLLLFCLAGLLLRNGVFLANALRGTAAAGLSQEGNLQETLAFSWLQEHTDSSDVAASFYDPLLYLYTDRKAVRLGDTTAMALRFYKENNSSLEHTALLRVLHANKVRYVVVRPADPPFAGFKDLADKYPRLFVLVYQAANTETRVYRVNREAESRTSQNAGQTHLNFTSF